MRLDRSAEKVLCVCAADACISRSLLIRKMASIVNDWIIVLAALLKFLPTFSGFNLDTKIPIVKLGNPDSYFGFSVAQHFVYDHRRSISDSWLEFRHFNHKFWC